MAVPLRASLALLLIASALGCESKLARLTPDELRDRIFECQTTREPGPALAIACDNYRRECTRRRNAGQYVC